MIADRIVIENNEIIFRLDLETAGANAAEIAIRARDEAIEAGLIAIEKANEAVSAEYVATGKAQEATEAADVALGAKSTVELIGSQVTSDREDVSTDREAVTIARQDVEEKAGIAEQAAARAEQAAQETASTVSKKILPLRNSLIDFLPDETDIYIDGFYSGPELRNNTLLFQDGTTSTVSGIKTYYKLPSIGKSRLKIRFVRLNIGSSSFRNANLVGYKSDNSTVDLHPTTSGTGGQIVDTSYDITAYDYISVSFSSLQSAETLVGIFNEEVETIREFTERSIREGKDNRTLEILSGLLPLENLFSVTGYYAGPELMPNRMLRNNGTTQANTAASVIFKIDISLYNFIHVQMFRFNVSDGNANLVGYRADGSTVDLKPNTPTSGGTSFNEIIEVSQFEFLSICFGNSRKGDTLVEFGFEIADFGENVKAYVDRKMSEGKSTNNKFKLDRLGKIFSATQSGLPSIYWAWIIHTDNIPNALGRYYMYYSTDHGGSTGGIGMAYSNNLLEWTNHGVVLTSLQQLGSSGEAETPSVVWDNYAGILRMYWQSQKENAMGYSQATHISESTDGINWIYKKLALDVPMAFVNGNGHNGYFMPIVHNNRYVATHLMGGGDKSYSGISYSYDGLNWWTRRDTILRQTHGMFANDVYSGGINETGRFQVNGRVYSIGGIGIPASGTNPKVTNLGITEIGQDYITIMGKAEVLLNMDPSLGESTDIRNVTSFTDKDGRNYVIYNCNNAFFLAELKMNQ